MTESRVISLLPVMVLVVASLSSAFTTTERPSFGWSSGTDIETSPQRWESPTTVLYSEKTKTATEKDQEKDDRISEMDARVLQSMLRDNKLDLEQTSNMKKLLERGIRKDNEDDETAAAAAGGDGEKEEEPYSSQVIKTLADTKFWKAFKRNAAEVLESVAISVTNEIEKGAKVLVGLGFFAWDRAKQDVARALPTAATVPQKKVFQLGETSSYVEPAAAPAAGDDGDAEPEMTPSQRAKSIRQEFTTPADEISAVASEIGKIFQRADRQMALQSQEDKSKDTRNPFYAAFVEEVEYQKQSGDGATPFYASTSLSSTASRGASRLDTAFQRSQKTKLAREKENLAVKGNRLASAAIDSAYQVRSEISGEENAPGYKTKQLRESTVDASRRLAAAAQKTAGFLGGARSFLLGGGGSSPEPQKPQQLPQAGAAGTNRAKADPVDFLDETAYFAFKREEPPPGGSEVPDAAAAAAAAGASPPGNFAASDAPPTVTETDFSGGIVIEDNKVIDTDGPKNDGGAFGFLSAFAKRGMGQQETQESEAPAVSSTASGAATPQQPDIEVMDVITDAEVVMANKDNFNYFDKDDVVVSSGDANGGTEYFTTGSYLDNMEPQTASATGAGSDDGLRQVTAEVITDDDDFDKTVFAQANTVDNMSAEDFLRQQAAEEAEENDEPNPFTRATLRTLDVAFLVVEKGVSVAPMAVELAQRAVSRAAEAKLKDSAGSQIGWELHNGNVRGDKRY